MRPFAVALALVSSLPAPAHAVRLKDLVEVEGFRGNALTGLGVVVGLANTGDDIISVATRRPLATIMKHLGVVIDPLDIRARNAALVMVTSELPPFARSGMPLDVLVSSVGTAKSLQGGTLIATPLKGADGQTYALAQGALTVGGFVAEGGSGTQTRKNHTTAGRIPRGALVERAGPGGLPREEVLLVLHEPDPATASRIAEAVNKALGEELALVRDPAAVRVKVGPKFIGKTVELVAQLGALEVEPDGPARVVVDERTGTVVVGANVTLSPAAIAHGGITVNVTERQAVSQPNPLGPQSSKTVTTQESEVAVDEKGGQLVAIKQATTVADVASALNALGIKPRDLVAIFQALKAAGALRAEIQVL